MRTRAKVIISVAALGGLLFMPGCTSLGKKALRLTQSLSMESGTLTVGAGGRIATVTVENLRQEDGKQKADELHLVSRTLEIHSTGYERQLIGKKPSEK